MKIQPNHTSLIEDMIRQPEKDWRKHLPFILLTEEDFLNAEKLFRKHIKNEVLLNEALEGLKIKKEYVFAGDSAYYRDSSCYSDFYRYVVSECLFNKRWKTREGIEKEIEEIYNIKHFHKFSSTLHDINQMFEYLFNSQSLRKNYIGLHQDLVQKHLITEEK